MLDYSARFSTGLKDRFIQVTFEFKPLLAQTEFCLFLCPYCVTNKASSSSYEAHNYITLLEDFVGNKRVSQ